MSNFARLSGGALALAVMFSAPATAAVVVDQSQTINNVNYTFLNAPYSAAQTFTAGASNSVGAGIFLSGQLGFTQSGNVTLSLFTGTPAGSGSLLASGTASGTGGNWVDVFWSQVGLSVGETYYLRATSPQGLVNTAGYLTPYAGGEAYFGTSSLAGGAYDLTFRTFTDNGVNAAVPEPATWAMMLVGFGAIGFGMRRRQKVSTKINFA